MHAFGFEREGVQAISGGIHTPLPFSVSIAALAEARFGVLRSSRAGQI